MDFQINLTDQDLNNIISVLYAQHNLDDQVALDLLDRLVNESDRCLAEHQGNVYNPSEQYLKFRHQLNRQLYEHLRSRSPRTVASVTPIR